MNTLRVLLVENDPTESERIAGRLERASHAVLSIGGLDEAAQALEIQRFDAVVLNSRVVNDQLLLFRESLNRFENTGKAPVRIPVLCYTSPNSEQPTADELSRYRVDACLPEDFEALSFSQLVSSLASELSAGYAGSTSSLPVLKADDFQEQVGFDRELVVEIIDLFFMDSAKQLESMLAALEANDMLVLSRVAHSIKGSLGSLFAMQAAFRAQVLEQVAKAGDTKSATTALAQLESELRVLKPELLRLRNAESGK